MLIETVFLVKTINILYKHRIVKRLGSLFSNEWENLGLVNWGTQFRSWMDFEQDASLAILLT